MHSNYHYFRYSAVVYYTWLCVHGLLHMIYKYNLSFYMYVNHIHVCTLVSKATISILYMYMCHHMQSNLYDRIIN